MTGLGVPELDHVARYCKPKTVLARGSLVKDEILNTAFERTSDHDYVSVNWLEYFDDDVDVAIKEVRSVVGRKLELRQSGRFAVLNVGLITGVAAGSGLSLTVYPRPSPDDPSHCGIYGVSTDPLEEAAKLAGITKLKPRWNLHLSGDENYLADPMKTLLSYL